MTIFNHDKYHFIGIGGIGISAIARMLRMQGKTVTGSDSEQSEITDDLARLGIEIKIGQNAENLPIDAEAVIYTVAIRDDNPELVEAKNRGLEIASYPQALGELSKNMYTIAISGTHGKTTTTAMIGHILTEAGLDPTIVVGSKILGENSNFHKGSGKYLVVEACEYKRSFLNLYPKILVITNIEAEHLDYYKDLADIQSAFKELSERVPSDEFVITEKEYNEVEVDHLNIPGQHNILNAKAAIKATEMVGVPREKALEYLQNFKGTWRRLEYKGERDGAVFYDDYAHHPTEIRAALSGLREKYPDRKLVCVFMPHTLSRTKILFNDFVEALQLADQNFIAPIYVTREAADNSISNKILAEATRGTPVENPEELKKELAKIDRTQPLCVVMMGAGSIYKWTPEIIE